MLHLFNDGNGDIGISAATTTSIVVAKTPLTILDLHFVVRMAEFKGGLTLANILPLALLTCTEVDNPITRTIHLFLNFVHFACICAFEGLRFF